jgi:selenocysteine lyase/cysteine desulfurase
MQAATALREALALLLNARSGQRISFQGNTSMGLNIIAQGIDWHQGDEILVPDIEFPSNVYPWHQVAKQHPVELKRIPTTNGRVTVDLVDQYVTTQTRVLALSAVQFLSGFRADLATIGRYCHDQDIRFIVDGIQAVGAMQLDVTQYHIDALAGGGHKWLMSPLGMGYLYVSEAMQDALAPSMVGWLSVEEPWNLFDVQQPLHPDAQRFELGTPNMAGIHGMLAAVRLHLELGPDSIERKIHYLTAHLQRLLHDVPLECVTSTQEHQRAGIVSYRLPESMDADALQNYFQSRNIDIAIREHLLRIAPHFYNTKSELSLVGRVLQEYLES